MRVRQTGLAIAALLFVADQAVKAFVIHGLRLPERLVLDLLPIFRLAWVENHGISMGFLTAGSDSERWLLVALTGAIAVAVLFWLWRERNRLDGAALGLVLGGALGNICDRVRLGYVADFLDLHFGDLHPFLVFNVADAAITVGVLLLVLRALFTRRPEQPAAAEDKNA
ncbi:signal peptidase II [Sphingomonas morindae]|uniref:Lipoprotein signal peptidase n=1 Tax=Sphingomonas morindae TaxID=1541170 RepID=A0ABY4XCX5_9SPHN|nr:signal peptidase II [Sphingomonas morindae]USI74525.1 signal peptidase II [Sphingomonas morindae]